MADPEVIEAEFSEAPSRELELRSEQHGQAVSLFGTDDPGEVVTRASATATALAGVIDQKGLFNMIQGKKYVRVEGWTLLGTMLGVFPVLESCEPIEVNGVKGYQATVAAQTRHGEIVGRATALCMRNENRWRTADEYAVSSMAQTRATSKCLRAPLGFVMQLAGYEATPEAEIPSEGFDSTPPPAAGPPPPQRILSTTLSRLEKGLRELTGTPGWAEGEVLATAAQTYKRKIEALGDLTEVEAQQIIKAMHTYGGVEV